MKALSTGKQNFRTLIKNNLLYVDKTHQMYKLIKRGSLYFLSRPRRFGKSLLISTFAEIFSGHEDLFKGLYIAEETDYDWAKSPVLQFNFAKFGHHVTDLEPLLKDDIRLKAEELGIQLTTSTLSQQVTELVTNLAKQQGPVVFLVDEYDKPIIDFLTDVKQANTNREVIRNFFAPMKDLEYKGDLRFLFVTGVSKFSKVSIFSDLNNLTDLTIDPMTDDLLGITQEELETSFQPYLAQVSEEIQLPYNELLELVKTWYDGYSWNGKTLLYNPYSLLNFFEKQFFGNFWFATGTPTFLVNMIRNQGVKPEQIEGRTFFGTYFEQFAIEKLDIYNLLFQTGYLTVKSRKYTPEGMEYKLGYPNREVHHAFIYNLLEAFTFQASNVVGDVLANIRNALKNGEVEIFIEQLKILLSDVSYHLMPHKARPKNEETAAEKQAKAQAHFKAWEGYFQTIIYLVTAFLGFSVQTEITKHKGRLDLIAQTQNFLYIMEFKLEEPAEDAIQQIKDRDYIASYKNSSKTIILVGINFSKEEKNIGDWTSERWGKT